MNEIKISELNELNEIHEEKIFINDALYDNNFDDYFIKPISYSYHFRIISSQIVSFFKKKKYGTNFTISYLNKQLI